MISKEEYLKNPCRASSLAYWKTNAISMLPDMHVVHDAEYAMSDWYEYIDERYFKLLHHLCDLRPCRVPAGYKVCIADSWQIASHIRACYPGCKLSVEEVESWKKRKTYVQTLWLSVCDETSGEIVASGIAEIDPEIGEGILEWIQVSSEHRRRGLGSYIVLELLNRMKQKARFVTVSGKSDDANSPQALYRFCGFTGDDVWHVLSKPK